MDLSVSAPEEISRAAPAPDLQSAQGPSSTVGDGDLVLEAGHPLQTASRISGNLLAVSLCDCDILVEQPHLGLEGTVADAEESREAVGGFLDGALLAGHVVVGVGLGNGELVLSLAEAAEDVLKTVALLLQKVVPALKFARTHVGLPPQLEHAVLFGLGHERFLKNKSYKTQSNLPFDQ